MRSVRGVSSKHMNFKWNLLSMLISAKMKTLSAHTSIINVSLIAALYSAHHYNVSARTTLRQATFCGASIECADAAHTHRALIARFWHSVIRVRSDPIHTWRSFMSSWSWLLRNFERFSRSLKNYAINWRYCAYVYGYISYASIDWGVGL